MPDQPNIVRVAVSGPFQQGLDYKLPADGVSPRPTPGMRVLVPLGSRLVVGVVLEYVRQPDVSLAKLKSISQLLDTQAVVSPQLLTLYKWASDYYHFPIGDVVLQSLPKLLRREQPLKFTECFVLITESGKEALSSLNSRAAKQQKLLQHLFDHAAGVAISDLKEQDFTLGFINKLVEKNWLLIFEKQRPSMVTPASVTAGEALSLNGEQQIALDCILKTQGFKPFLLAGVTGSGKTEVYMQAMERVLAQGKKVLVLLPEIALTPQTVMRFQERFSVKVLASHSRLADGARAAIWMDSYRDGPLILIGTRSAVFAPLFQLGMIVIDEEHDMSFKQQAGFRYHARDVAMMRAKQANIPIILGSATPALETFNNAWKQKYQLLELTQKAMGGAPAAIKVVDVRGTRLEDGFAESVVAAMQAHLANDGQVLVFLNRRGYAPLVMCHHCGYVVNCQYCDARLVWHKGAARLQCHHCNYECPWVALCPECRQEKLSLVGFGTQRMVEALQKYFPDEKVVRVDRDTTSRKDSWQDLWQQVTTHQVNILVGTQMLAKGHHFKHLSLVVIVDVDAGLFSLDFRATEHMAQLLLQVSGRAGRESTQGEVLLQTYHPEHPLLQTLLNSSYQDFLRVVVKEREQTRLPPYSHLALVQAESMQSGQPLSYLQRVSDGLNLSGNGTVEILGPVVSNMERKANYYRAHILLRCASRSALQHVLQNLPDNLRRHARGMRIKWSLDVDPQQVY